MILAIYIFVTVVAVLALAQQLKRDLVMLQQNSYRSERFRHWMEESGESTRYDRLAGFVVFLFALLPMIGELTGMILVFFFALWNFIRLARAKYKKPLVMTARARRIYIVAAIVFIVAAGCALAAFRATGAEGYEVVALAAVLAYSGSYVIILFANWLLGPTERRINKKYYDEAASMLASMPDLKVIGITGSYGKTSTKHYLTRILQEKYDVLMTPGNFNTTLGVIRTVRENMKPYNEVFVVEMGAKQPGDIKEICDLVHPTVGIITAVGPQHLESFKTIENVQATKFELADALPADGLAVVNNDFPYIANRSVENVECLRYTAEGSDQAEYRADEIQYSPQGTDFTIFGPGGAMLKVHTKLVGRCNVSNLVAAVLVAARLGVEPEKIRYAIEKIEQVEHRLNVKRTPGGITIIDDAYNSNPVGSAMALEVLGGMKGGKRIIITPGMVELGEEQEHLNKEFGAKIPANVDVAIIVGAYNRDAILEGIRSTGMDEKNVHAVDTFAQAQALLPSIAASGDTVLYENDLPDTFK